MIQSRFSLQVLTICSLTLLTDSMVMNALVKFGKKAICYVSLVMHLMISIACAFSIMILIAPVIYVCLAGSQ